MKKYGTLIIFGASSGIGLAVSEYLNDKCEELITVSRRRAHIGHWIKTDVSKIDEINHLADKLNGKRIDGLLYLGGTWEAKAFTDDYSFESCSDFDLENVLNVNLLAPMRITQKLLPNLKKSDSAKIIIIGAAVGGLNLNNGKEVSNTSSKFGLRGLVFSLRQLLKNDRIGITLINPGYTATPEVLNDLKQVGRDDSCAIPLTDLFAIIECTMSLSNRTNINEIDMPTMV